MKKPRFSRQDWIDLGLKELSLNGSDAVKLEAICKAAGLTRGSFYHHFNDHENFLTALAQHWLKAQTEDVAAAIDPKSSSDDQNTALTKAAMEIDYKLELGIRELGRRLPAVYAVIQRADAMRLNIVSELYQARYGLKAEMADAYAYLEYAAFSGIILLDPETSRERQQALADLFDDMVARALSVKASR